MRWSGHIACTGGMRNEDNILFGKPEGKTPFGRRQHRGEDNIRMGIREIRWEGLHWMHLDQDRNQW